jgi:uncharacterized MAPEG superfamily protein
MPLFTAAVILGHVVGLDRKYLDRFALQFLLVRTAHTVSYVATKRQRWSFLRTVFYVWSVALCVRVLAKAAKKG